LGKGLARNHSQAPLTKGDGQDCHPAFGQYHSQGGSQERGGGNNQRTPAKVEKQSTQIKDQEKPFQLHAHY
jgi:hypothetical protein